MIDRIDNPAVLQTMTRFRDFWSELDAVVSDVRAKRWMVPAYAKPGADVPAGDGARNAAVDALFLRLQDAVLTHGGVPPARLAYGQSPIDLGYVMAALADETLLYLPEWNGPEIWGRRLLEEHIYGTRIAGERLFDEIAIRLSRRTKEGDEVDIGLLLALALGFRGKYRLSPAIEAEAEVDRLRGRLYQAAFFRPAPARIDWENAMGYPQAFQAGELLRLPRLYPWVAACAAVVGLYVLFAHLVWSDNLDGVLKYADAIVADSRFKGY